LVKEGKKIVAIQKYREQFGVGLKEANEYLKSISK